MNYPFIKIAQQTLTKIIKNNPLFYICLILEAEKKRLQLLQTEGAPVLLCLENYFPYYALEYRNLAARQVKVFKYSFFSRKKFPELCLGLTDQHNNYVQFEEVISRISKGENLLKPREIRFDEKEVLEALIDIEYSILTLDYYSRILAGLLALSFFLL